MMGLDGIGRAARNGGWGECTEYNVLPSRYDSTGPSQDNQKRNQPKRVTQQGGGGYVWASQGRGRRHRGKHLH